jgi:hypothetical protein
LLGLAVLDEEFDRGFVWPPNLVPSPMHTVKRSMSFPQRASAQIVIPG